MGWRSGCHCEDSSSSLILLWLRWFTHTAHTPPHPPTLRTHPRPPISFLLLQVTAALGLPFGADGDGSASSSSGRWGAAGAPYRCLPGLQALLKGHRPGEVSDA